MIRMKQTGNFLKETYSNCFSVESFSRLLLCISTDDKDFCIYIFKTNKNFLFIENEHISYNLNYHNTLKKVCFHQGCLYRQIELDFNPQVVIPFSMASYEQGKKTSPRPYIKIFN